ncbi:hypothetical protein W02_05160 [Nitrospira sp. KM1]|uniref:hypothetical protein n=1 Tax=Nitrospira sp. KM1 TaxID=1936990 RepID=UPI0013A76935|nr:hypothetical protein [Nitrospira sp. KM1]BCA53376.1 hypothetical protein W02_05160 [Nitrospira sp. KM1]
MSLRLRMITVPPIIIDADGQPSEETDWWKNGLSSDGARDSDRSLVNPSASNQPIPGQSDVVSASRCSINIGVQAIVTLLNGASEVISM